MNDIREKTKIAGEIYELAPAEIKNALSLPVLTNLGLTNLNIDQEEQVQKAFKSQIIEIMVKHFTLEQLTSKLNKIKQPKT